VQPDLTDLLHRARELVACGGRVLGIAGAPGAGKSTLATALVEAWGDGAQLLPMDGFHLADDELARLRRGDRKGAPDTFDVDGYVAALSRVRTHQADVLVPRFDRSLEAAIAGSLRVSVATELVVTEGNYLLLDAPGWRDVRRLLDEAWLLVADDELRVPQLVARHVAHGRTDEAARAWVLAVDEPNAALVAAASGDADLVVRR
jgi:pantothenate kinase